MTASQKPTSFRLDTVAALSYLWLLWVIPLYFYHTKASYRTPEVSWHLRQGIILFVFELLLTLVNWIPYFGGLLYFAGVIFAIWVSVLGLMKALSGEKWRLPLIGRFAQMLEL